MTDRNDLRALKAIAKRRARAQRIALSKALDAIASALGLPHWNALTTAWEKGWRPTSPQLEAVRGPCDQMASPRQVGHIQEGCGEIDGEPYELEVDFDSVLIGGNGWAIHVGHAPSEKAQVERHVTPNPLDDPAFFKEVMKIANAAADRVRELICSGLAPPVDEARSCRPYNASVVPRRFLPNGSAFTAIPNRAGEQMAANMWHCPKCSATPLDIHPAPF